MRFQPVYDEETGDVAVGRIALWCIAVVVLIAVLTLGSWGIGIWTAPWAGRANLHRQLNSPTNIRFETNHFYTLDATIKADAKNVGVYAAQAKAYRDAHAGQPDPIGKISDQEAQDAANVSGVQALCQQAVTEYNNAAINFTEAPFRQNNLPTQEDPTQCNAPS